MTSTNLQQSPVTAVNDLASPFVSMPDDEAVASASQHYGIHGRVTRFATEKDDTFRLQREEGQRFILKVANPAEPDDEIAFQIELLTHVANSSYRVPVPRVIPAQNGQLLPAIVDRAGQRRRMRLMTYLEGTPLDSTDSSAEERERVGATLARLRLAMQDFMHPAASRTVLWDIKHLKCLQPLLDEVTDPNQRRKLTQGMDRFLGLTDRIAGLRTQVLHNDFSRSNIIVDHDDPQFVTGIVDFGDAVATAVAIDVATALLNQLPRDLAARPVDDLFAEGRDLLRGYLRMADLTAKELQLIPHLVMGRVIARALITHWRAKLFPRNATYILRNTEPGWAQLDWFLARSMGAVSKTLINHAG